MPSCSTSKRAAGTTPELIKSKKAKIFSFRNQHENPDNAAEISGHDNERGFAPRPPDQIQEESFENNHEADEEEIRIGDLENSVNNANQAVERHDVGGVEDSDNQAPRLFFTKTQKNKECVIYDGYR